MNSASTKNTHTNLLISRPCDIYIGLYDCPFHLFFSETFLLCSPDVAICSVHLIYLWYTSLQMIDYTFLANESLLNFRWQLRIWSLFLFLPSLSHGDIQHLTRFGHDLILIGVKAEEFYTKAVGGVHHRDRNQAWECPCGQFETAPSRELHS